MSRFFIQGRNKHGEACGGSDVCIGGWPAVAVAIVENLGGSRRTVKLLYIGPCDLTPEREQRRLAAAGAAVDIVRILNVARDRGWPKQGAGQLGVQANANRIVLLATTRPGDED